MTLLRCRKRDVMNFFSPETMELDYSETMEKLYTDDQVFGSQLSAATAHAFDAVNDAIFVVDMTMQIQHWNRAAEQIYGWSHIEVIGRSILDIIPVLRYLNGSDATTQMHAVTTTGTWRGEVVQHTRDGREIFIDSSMRTFTNDDGLVIGVIVINRDITARKQAEASLRENETRLHLLAEYAHDMIFRYRLAPTITLEYISPIIEQLTGYPREVFYNDPELTVRLLTPFDACIVHSIFSPSEVPVRPVILHWHHKDGTPRCAELYSWQVTDETGNPLTLEGIVRDITERTQAEAELRASAEQLKHLSRRLLEAHERERRHIACELHDEVGQVLTGLKLTLAVAAASAPASLVLILDSAQTTINDLMGRVRALSLDLRPALLDDKGLLPALTWYLERYTSRTGVQIDLRHEGVSCRFPSEVETVAYRIIQESLTNVARHAGVHKATVRLLANTTHLMLRVDDQGRGFDSLAAMAAQTTGGLSGMYERVQLIGGVLTIESVLGNGTRIIAELPLPSVEHNP